MHRADYIECTEQTTFSAQSRLHATTPARLPRSTLLCPARPTLTTHTKHTYLCDGVLHSPTRVPHPALLTNPRTPPRPTEPTRRHSSYHKPCLPVRPRAWAGWCWRAGGAAATREWTRGRRPPAARRRTLPPPPVRAAPGVVPREAHSAMWVAVQRSTGWARQPTAARRRALPSPPARMGQEGQEGAREGEAASQREAETGLSMRFLPGAAHGTSKPLQPHMRPSDKVLHGHTLGAMYVWRVL